MGLPNFSTPPACWSGKNEFGLAIIPPRPSLLFSKQHEGEGGGRDTRLHDLRALRIAYFRVLLPASLVVMSPTQHNAILLSFQNLV